MRLIVLFLVSSLLTTQYSYSQDSLKIDHSSIFKLKTKHFIIPTLLLSAGIIVREQKYKTEIYNFHDNLLKDKFKFKYDDVLQCLPTTLAVLGKPFSIQSKSSYEQLCTNQVVSLTLSGLLVRVLKLGINDKRPNTYGVHSFPSGHTTTAFNAATLMFLEYKDSNLAFASSGYAIAIATGFFRISNNKHWVSDVLAGAGIGMTTAYLVHNWSPNLFKYVEKYIFPQNASSTQIISYPIISENSFGLGLRLNFK